MAPFSFSTLELRKQLLLLVVLMFIPVIGILLYTGFQAYEDARHHTEKNARQLIDLFIEEQIDIIDQARQFLNVVSHVPAVKTMDIPACNRFLKTIHANHPRYTTIVVSDTKGVIECCAIPLKTPIHVADRTWFKRVMEKRDFIIDHFLISRSSQKASLPFAYPILGPDGSVLAAVGAAFDVTRYQKLFDSVPLPRGSVILLTDRTGKLLYQSFAGENYLGKPLYQCLGFDLPQGPRGSFRIKDLDGKKREYWFERISVDHEDNEICLLIGILEQTILSGAKKVLMKNLALLGLVAASSLAIAWFFGNRLIFNPISRLLDRTRLVQKGDFRVPDAADTFPGELAILSRAFDDMVVTLARREKDRDDAYMIINNSPLVGFIWKNEPGWPVEFVTGNLEQVFGYPPGDMMAGSIPYDQVLHPDDLKRVAQTVVDFSRDAACKSFAHQPFRLVTGSGELRWVDQRVYIKRDERGFITHYHGILLDITERRQAEEEIRNLRNYLSDIIDSMPSVLIGVDREGRVTQWNLGAQQVTGISKKAAQGHRLETVFPMMPDEQAHLVHAVSKAVENRQIISDPKVPRKEGDQIRYNDITVFPLTDGRAGGAVIRIDDVTEKIRMEEVLIQNEKMLSVGGLAAGMAHEINNPLAGVIQNIHVLENRITSSGIPANAEAAASLGTTVETIAQYMVLRDIPRIITAIKNSGARMAVIVKNMLSFARKEEAAFTRHDPAELLDETLELAGTDYDLKKEYDFKSIAVKKEYDDDLPGLYCEGGKIQQVVLNLLNNGAHAMFERKKTPGAPPPVFILRLLYTEGSGMLQIEIEDNGTGIDAAISKKIFDPFFTTKPVGVGTGLGLSVSYFIITESHGGTMEVVSEPGNGARFIIRLPVRQNGPRA